jgi:hypothetical protein
MYSTYICIKTNQHHTELHFVLTLWIKPCWVNLSYSFTFVKSCSASLECLKWQTVLLLNWIRVSILIYRNLLLITNWILRAGYIKSYVIEIFVNFFTQIIARFIALTFRIQPHSTFILTTRLACKDNCFK